MLAKCLLLVVFIHCFRDFSARKVYRHSYIYHSSNQNEDEPRFDKSYPSHRIKKQTIAKGQEHEHTFKRGFLSNLATLLNDAELMSKKNSGISSANTTLLPEQETAETKKDEDPTVKSLTETPDKKDKKEPTPSVGSVENTLKTEGKDTAPIFALFHGKIVPLGKLPETSFKKSHTETKPKDQTSENDTGHDEGSHENTDSKSSIKLPENSSHSFRDQQSEKKSNEKSLSPSQLSRLSSYFHNLESKSKTGSALETRMIKSPVKDVTATAKDEVPDILPAMKNTEFLRHVKGILLDDGKMVSLKEQQQQAETETENDEDASVKGSEGHDVREPGKSYAIDNNLLSQFTKSKEETSDPVARDTQSVAMDIESLKKILGKGDNAGISLEKVLNKPQQEAVVNTEDEDPGTIEDFAAGGLKKTNDYRALHHSQPLVWSDELANEAQKMAEHLADIKSLEISKDLEKRGYGENVAKVWAPFKSAGSAAATMWYQQSTNYHYEDPHLNQDTGQFTQIVWKDSKELGMGVAKSIDDVNNKYVYVVALYRPPGNIETTLRDNVYKTGNDTTDVYSTFFKRSKSIKHNGVLLPQHKPGDKK